MGLGRRAFLWRGHASGWGFLAPKGEEFTEDNVGSAMAMRELMKDLRERGEARGGPAPMDKKDRSRFLGKLDQMIQGIQRAKL